MEARLPAKLEVTALIRRVEAAGGFAAVLHRGDPDSGTLLLVMVEKGEDARVFERMPQPDGCREWRCAVQQTGDDESRISEYLARRAAQDSDLWIVELDIAQAERFIR